MYLFIFIYIYTYTVIYSLYNCIAAYSYIINIERYNIASRRKKSLTAIEIQNF